MQTIKDLILKRLRETLTPVEEQALEAWMAESDRNRAIVEEITDPQQLAESFAKLDSLHSDQVWERVRLISTNPQTKSHPLYRRLRTLTGYAAAALLLIAAGIYFHGQHVKRVLTVRSEVKLPIDVPAPSANRSVITLSDGRSIYIDSAKAGVVAIQGNVHIRKNSDGSIEYIDNGYDGHLQYNTLTVPRGSQVASIILSDGSKVVVNVGSTMRYPISFLRRERGIEIVGEAYIEVVKDAHRRFIVAGGGMITEVLGTHFNVNTYPDETDVKVTLLEGSVKVSGGIEQKVIKPGEQAVYGQGMIQVHTGVDVNQVIAWKNGFFDFQDKHLPEVMRQLSRWYDLQVVYNGKVPDIEFFGQMGRNLKLSDVLNVLRDAGLHFRMEEGRRLIVL
ncbi:FecR family protein [Agriterribacter sp.]|uniref:FecR family protein n=1 Tax=Agriterribacter sp. TaxID=2821509 RepID=UPI002B79EF5F|nr:FecR domain-containing protein [Agriterribacter sp.]HTN05337.1 FecR domain-containing protein [Agriterribacter sp.]